MKIAIKIKTVGALALLGTSLLIGAEYIIPPKIDNTINSVESKQPVLITNYLPTSTRTKSIGARTVKYRCATIPKIVCRGVAPEIATTISEISLRESSNNELVNIFAYDAFTETTATSSTWQVCGAAVGGMTWDDSKINLAADGVTLTHSYTPNAHSEVYYFFTDQGNKGDPRSYMAIDTKQTCK